MMSGTLAALVQNFSHPHSASHPLSPTLLAHCELLIVRLQDPYFRAILTHLTLSSSPSAWSDVLTEAEGVFPFQERLAIAFAFLDDAALSSYLLRHAQKGDLDALILTGLSSTSSKAVDVLQKYVDRTGDVQSAALLCSLSPPASTRPTLNKASDRQKERWIEMYRDLLDGWKMHHWRVGFDIERGRILMEAGSGDTTMGDWVPQQVLIRCNYCNKPVSGSKGKTRPTACPHCGRALPRCSVCLMTLAIVQDTEREAELAYSPYRDTIDDAIVICQTCRHGGHASHILEWFFDLDGERSHGVCAVADCDCRCADEF